MVLQSEAELRVDGGFFACEFGFEGGDFVEVIGVLEEFGELGGDGFVGGHRGRFDVLGAILSAKRLEAENQADNYGS